MTFSVGTRLHGMDLLCGGIVTLLSTLEMVANKHAPKLDLRYSLNLFLIRILDLSGHEFSCPTLKLLAPSLWSSVKPFSKPCLMNVEHLNLSVIEPLFE